MSATGRYATRAGQQCSGNPGTGTHTLAYGTATGVGSSAVRHGVMSSRILPTVPLGSGRRAAPAATPARPARRPVPSGSSRPCRTGPSAPAAWPGLRAGAGHRSARRRPAARTGRSRRPASPAPRPPAPPAPPAGSPRPAPAGSGRGSRPARAWNRCAAVPGPDQPGPELAQHAASKPGSSSSSPSAYFHVIRSRTASAA